MNIKDNIEERAAHYSFKIKSVLYNQLPMELQTLWKQEIEQAYRAGATEMLNHPTGKELLYVCNRSFDNGRKDVLDALDIILRTLKESATQNKTL